ncbi:MAG: MlaD family protein [Bacteroidales bacterium]
MHFKLTKEAKIGIITILTLCLFIWVASFLKGRNLLTSEKQFYALYTNSGGIAVSSPVVLNGVKIGRVSKVGFVSETDPTIKLTLNVQKHLFIPDNSIASLETSGLLGGKNIVLYLGNSKTNKKAKTYFKSREVPDLLAQLDPLKQKAGSLLSSIDSVLFSLNAVLNERSITNLSSSFESLKISMQNIEVLTQDAKDFVHKDKDNFSNLIHNVESISANLKNNNETINQVIANFSSISDSLAKANVSNTITKLNTTLDNTNKIVTKINSGQGSIGMLVHNDSLYNQLSSSATQLNLLLEDLRKNPGRYIKISVFGNKNK